MYDDEPKLIYVTETGNKYSTREEAEEDVLENMLLEEFSEAFAFVVGWDKLLKWAVKQESFFGAFEDEISEANQIVFDGNITVYEDEDF